MQKWKKKKKNYILTSKQQSVTIYFLYVYMTWGHNFSNKWYVNWDFLNSMQIRYDTV